MAHNRPDVTDIYPWKALSQVDPKRIAAIVDLTALQAVEGSVWCDKHGEVHRDTLNPYGYSADPGNDFCTNNDHRAIYMEPDDIIMGHPTSDEDPSSFVPESGLTPGGSCRVPSDSVPDHLLVRRHTPSTRATWRSKLLDVLPPDMLDEDKERIADDLIDRAIAMGNELRRKRLVDKLHLAVDEMYQFDRDPDTKLQDLPLNEWQDVLRDAADEIRSMLP